jgi:hypothetical protein
MIETIALVTVFALIAGTVAPGFILRYYIDRDNNKES